MDDQGNPGRETFTFTTPAIVEPLGLVTCALPVGVLPSTNGWTPVDPVESTKPSWKGTQFPPPRQRTIADAKLSREKQLQTHHTPTWERAPLSHSPPTEDQTPLWGSAPLHSALWGSGRSQGHSRVHPVRRVRHMSSRKSELPACAYICRHRRDHQDRRAPHCQLERKSEVPAFPIVQHHVGAQYIHKPHRRKRAPPQSELPVGGLRYRQMVVSYRSRRGKSELPVRRQIPVGSIIQMANVQSELPVRCHLSKPSGQGTKGWSELPTPQSPLLPVN